MNYQTEHDADDAHARTGYKYKTNELTQLRARVAKLEAVCQRIVNWECTCKDGGPGFQCEVCEAREALEDK